MGKSASEVWTFRFACLRCSDVWLEEREADYFEPMSFIPFADCVIGKVEILGTAALPSIPDWVQPEVSDSKPVLYRNAGLLEKHNTA